MKIIVIEPGSAAIHIADAIRYLGFEPIILCSINEYGGDQRKYIEKHGYYEVDASKVKNIIHCISDNKILDIFGIISTADRFIVQACQAAISIGVKGMDPALLKLNNKAEVVQFAKEDSPPTIIFNRNTIPTKQLEEMLAYSGALVIKPSMSAGAKGLFEVTTTKEIEILLEFMKKETQVNVLDQEWLAQPCIYGVLYSLEGFVLHGQVNYIGLSRRSRIKYTESQNKFPVDDEVESEVHLNFSKIIEKLVKISGYKNGYFHTEIIFDGKKAFLVDANFGRIGGGSIALQIAKSTGKSIKEIFAHVIRTTFFPEHLSHKNFYTKKKVKTLSILYGVDKESALIEILFNGIIKSDHLQLADKGKQLKPPGHDNRSWVGAIIGNETEVLQEIKLISILTDKGILSPVF